MPLYTRVVRVDKLGRHTPVKLRWNDMVLGGFLNIAEEQGILEELRNTGSATLKTDAYIVDSDIEHTSHKGTNEEGREVTYLGYQEVNRKQHYLRAGTILEMWRAW